MPKFNKFITFLNRLIIVLSVSCLQFICILFLEESNKFIQLLSIGLLTLTCLGYLIPIGTRLYQYQINKIFNTLFQSLIYLKTPILILNKKQEIIFINQLAAEELQRYIPTIKKYIPSISYLTLKHLQLSRLSPRKSQQHGYLSLNDKSHTSLQYHYGNLRLNINLHPLKLSHTLIGHTVELQFCSVVLNPNRLLPSPTSEATIKPEVKVNKNTAYNELNLQQLYDLKLSLINFMIKNKAENKEEFLAFYDNIESLIQKKHSAEKEHAL